MIYFKPTHSTDISTRQKCQEWFAKNDAKTVDIRQNVLSQVFKFVDFFPS